MKAFAKNDFFIFNLEKMRKKKKKQAGKRTKKGACKTRGKKGETGWHTLNQRTGKKKLRKPALEASFFLVKH